MGDYSDDEADRDPSNLVTSPPSVFVTVVNTGRHDINGLLGIVVSYNMEHERYLVHMTRSQSTMALKKHHLKRAGMLESYLAQAQQLRFDPRVREKMSKYLNLCQKFVSPLKLSDVVGAGSVVLFCLVYSLGFVKTIVLTCFVGLVAGIAGQDLAGGTKKVIDNFPARSKALIEKQIPYLRGKVSNGAAVGVILVLAVLCMQSLLLSGTTRPVYAPSKSRSFSKQQVIDKSILETYYSLGYEDAIKGRIHGSSLEGKLVDLRRKKLEELEPMREATSGKDVGDDDDMIGGKKRRLMMTRLLRLPNFASLIYLYRSVIELGTDRTSLFSIGQLAANFQHHVEWWRKLIILLSVYHVIRIFV